MRKYVHLSLTASFVWLYNMYFMIFVLKDDVRQRSSRIIWNISFLQRRRKQRTEKEWSKRKRQYCFRDTFLEIHFFTFCNLRFYQHNVYDLFHIKQDIYSLLCCFFTSFTTMFIDNFTHFLLFTFIAYGYICLLRYEIWWVWFYHL